MDDYSRYTNVHLQKQLTSEEILEAKNVFEAHCRHHQVHVQHYHADNGRFADNLFVQDAIGKGQTLSYCGVNAHWQNGIAERMIRTLRETARTQLLHSIERWPIASYIHLWPYSIRYSADIHNQTHKKEEDTPLSKFTGIDAFGCPIYALDCNLASRISIGDWNKRARLGMYLGSSPRHAKTVSLVLNINNGLVSPQFHIRHDDFFETIDNKEGNMEALGDVGRVDSCKGPKEIPNQHTIH